MIDGQKRGFMQFQDVRAFLDSILDEDIHTKRVDSLANATLGVMTGASLGVALIGKSLAQASVLHGCTRLSQTKSSQNNVLGRK
jgi:hypothetical protein